MLHSWDNVDEIVDVPPLENRSEAIVYSHTNLEGVRSHEREFLQLRQRQPSQRADRSNSSETILENEPSTIVTQLYTYLYLIFFSILRILVRKGIAALTTYPGTLVDFDTIWANFIGCLIIGFLKEDYKLFLH